MTCPRCGLPDTYRGQGDGISSCECSRCDCCDAGPDDCDCRRDYEDLYDEPEEPTDYLCNDTACPVRQARIDWASRNPRAAAIAEIGDAQFGEAGR